MSVTVLGFGSRWRRDDAVGLLAVPALCARGVEASEVHGDGLALAERMRGCSEVVIVDAMRSGAAPGVVREIDAASTPLGRGVFPASTHVFGVAEGIDLARRLGWLPGAVTVIGVEGADFGQGEGLTDEVEAAIAEVVERIAARLGIAGRGGTRRR